MKKKNKIKALCLLSGGLDSRLACKIMQEQAEVEAVYFDLPFGSGCCKSHCAFNFAQMSGIKMRIIDCTKGILFKKYIDMLRHPKYGYGAGINPCIDCHIFILKEAKKLAAEIKADIIVTGEVLNERPMSQHKKALQRVEEESGLKGMLLRTLSAKFLPETEAEKRKLIDRSKLLDLQGRQRKMQIELAEKYNINYPSPGGGCMLCEKEFSAKLRDLLKNEARVSEKDIQLLKIGRHFRINGIKVIVGRSEEENSKLEILSEKGNLLIEACDGIPSPVTLIRNEKETPEIVITLAAGLTAKYSDGKNDSIKVRISSHNGDYKEQTAKKPSQEEIEKLRIN